MTKMMSTMRLNFIKRVMMSLLLAGSVQAQVSDTALQELEGKRDFALTARAELLAPKALEKAQTALRDYQKSKVGKTKPERLQKQQSDTQQAWDKVDVTIAQSNKTLQTVIKAYDDARAANAPATQVETWNKAEQRFKQAIAKAESNDLEGARKKGAEAEVLLRDVELAAIQYNVLNEARQLIAQARDNKVQELAPRTLSVAEQQLTLAEQQLARNRYELTEPHQLAQSAAYEARHAQYLHELIAAAKAGDKTQVAESQWLAIESPLQQLLSNLGGKAQFDQGHVAVITTAVQRAQAQQQALVAAQQTVAEREQDIADLRSQLSDTNAALKKLEARLGGESEERLALQKKLSAQERLRDNISKVEALFTADEARVFRQANQMVISLTGLNFRSGKSAIEPASFALLAKVGDALHRFPDADITVEGHTDNQGTDSANLLLSQDRADAVRQYLITNLGANAEKTTSIGYGKTRPVTSNDSESGRARNRRIDVVMRIEGL